MGFAGSIDGGAVYTTLIAGDLVLALARRVAVPGDGAVVSHDDLLRLRTCRTANLVRAESAPLPSNPHILQDRVKVVERPVTSVLIRVLASVCSGRGSVLHVVGEAGVGNTTRIGAALAAVQDCMVLRETGARAEQHIASAGSSPSSGGSSSLSAPMRSIPTR